jgi:DNA-binding HxlR family transcriptional regulator
MKELQLIRTCSIWRALEVIGDLPTLLILESHWFGARKFNEFSKRTGLLKTVISDRLNKLVAAECLKKNPYSKNPVRYEYGPTPKLMDLYKTSLSMLAWEREWGERAGKITVKLIHKSCGNPTKPVPVCGGCRAPIDAREMDWQEGPGVGQMSAAYSRRRRRRLGSGQSIPTTLFDSVSKIIGDRASTLIIRSIFTGINRFAEIQTDSGLATNVLSDRLLELRTGDLIYRTPDANQTRRGVYKMTEKGRALYPILMMLMEWGDKWYAAPEGPPLKVSHKSCGAPLVPEMACSACGEFIEIGTLEYEIIEADKQLEKIATVS